MLFLFTDLFAAKKDLDKLLGEEDKKVLLGPMYWVNRLTFKFLSEEKALLISIKSLCASLVDKVYLVHASPAIEDANNAIDHFHIRAGKTKKICQGKGKTVYVLDLRGRTITSYLKEWAIESLV
jgi:hypothetical protein